MYHNSSDWGQFAILQSRPDADGCLRRRQRCYPLSALPSVLEHLPRDTDTWISQADFTHYNRRKVNLARICVCFVDLDTYNTPDYHNRSPEEIVHELLLYCHDHKLPAPSLILYSGRGLQAKWLLSRSLPPLALPRWEAVQKQLVEHFRPFGADPRSRDVSRVLRVSQTPNTRAGEYVRPLYIANGPDEPDRWDFEVLANELLLLPRKVCEARRQQAARRRALAALAPPETKRPRQGGIRALDAASLWWARLQDLRTLVRLRGWEAEGIPAGHRNAFLLIGGCAVVWCLAASEWKTEIDALAAAWCPTWSDAERDTCVYSVLGRAKEAAFGAPGNDKLRPGTSEETPSHEETPSKEPRYRWKNPTLIEFLGITPAEQTHLSTIVSKDESRARDRLRHRKESDREAYEQRAAERRQEAHRLRGAGKTNREIAAQLGLSVETVKSYFRSSGKSGGGSSKDGESRPSTEAEESLHQGAHQEPPQASEPKGASQRKRAI